MRFLCGPLCRSTSPSCTFMSPSIDAKKHTPRSKIFGALRWRCGGRGTFFVLFFTPAAPLLSNKVGY